MTFQFSLEGIEPLDRSPYEFLPIQLGWLEALESGNYAQGQGLLRSSTDEYCCLGVLAELSSCDRRLASIGTAYQYRHEGDSSAPYEEVGVLPFKTRRDARLNSCMGAFKRGVIFPGVDYGESLPALDRLPAGHGSLAAMNDVRCIRDGDTLRAFNFREIAAYIRHDPWNVFGAPNVIAFAPSPIEQETLAA